MFIFFDFLSTEAVHGVEESADSKSVYKRESYSKQTRFGVVGKTSHF